MNKRQASQRPTLRTIAQMSGLAVTTVSRALADDPHIAQDTREKVRKLADEVGYAPDRAAQRLRTGKTNVISLILNPHDEILGFGTSIIRGITAALRGTPYHLVVMPDFADSEPMEQVSRIVRNHLADGVIFSRTEPDDARIRFLLERGFPFVSHGRSELATPHPFVDYDNYAFARQATERLIAAGSVRPAILLPPRRFTFANHQLHGFMSAVREHGVAHEILTDITLDSPGEQIEARLLSRLGLPGAPDGLVCAGEVSGLAAIAAAVDSGLVPGRDFHIVVKQTSTLFSHVRPRVASIYEDLTEAGEHMGHFILRRIAGEPAEALQFLQVPPDPAETPHDTTTRAPF